MARTRANLGSAGFSMVACLRGGAWNGGVGGAGIWEGEGHLMAVSPCSSPLSMPCAKEAGETQLQQRLGGPPVWLPSSISHHIPQQHQQHQARPGESRRAHLQIGEREVVIRRGQLRILSPSTPD
jgi:hypothetical protein